MPREMTEWERRQYTQAGESRLSVPGVPISPGVELTERQKKILATIRAYIASYRRVVLRKNRVTEGEPDELRTKGLVDARGALTKTGRLVIGYKDPWP